MLSRLVGEVALGSVHETVLNLFLAAFLTNLLYLFILRFIPNFLASHYGGSQGMPTGEDRVLSVHLP